MKLFEKKVILVTGGTGSFGKTIVKYFLNYNLKEVRIFSRDEKKQEDMRLSLNEDKLKFIIGDVRDYDSIYNATKNVDYIFHAAALKQVPTCEFYPMEAIKTNILGADNVIRAAIENKVKKVVLLSTDKAVYPINAMGMSKAMMEKIMVSNMRFNNPHNTIICATRYGNVMASRGSVIPLFIKQINESRSLTITDPKMTRFLMSLDESINLVLYAFKNGTPGDIFIQKAPASTIGDLALAIKEIFKSKSKIKTIGTRHGEKLFETLISKEEMLRSKDLGNYYCIRADSRDLNYNKYFIEGEKQLSSVSDYTSHNTKILNKEEVKNLLLKLSIVKESLND
jgi:UDP-glucose 4-epimerase